MPPLLKSTLGRIFGWGRAAIMALVHAARSRNSFRGDVDAVLLYVDGTDPQIAEARTHWLRQTPPKETDRASTAARRYLALGEIEFVLRSMDLHAPWLRKIYVLAESRVPEAVRAHPKVVLIKNSAIVPPGQMPLFNSAALELFLDQIPALSEHFLYFNDDTFLGRTTHKSDFFTAEGKSRTTLARAGINELTRPTPSKNSDDYVFFKAMRSTAVALARELGEKRPRAAIHQARAMRKSVVTACKLQFPAEVNACTQNRFRDVHDFALCLLAYHTYGYWQGAATVGHYTLPNFLHDHFYADIGSDPSPNQAAFNRLLAERPMLFCLNSQIDHPEQNQLLCRFLAKYFRAESRPVTP